MGMLSAGLVITGVVQPGLQGEAWCRVTTGGFLAEVAWEQRLEGRPGRPEAGQGCWEGQACP